MNTLFDPDRTQRMDARSLPPPPARRVSARKEAAKPRTVTVFNKTFTVKSLSAPKDQGGVDCFGEYHYGQPSTYTAHDDDQARLLRLVVLIVFAGCAMGAGVIAAILH